MYVSGRHGRVIHTQYVCPGKHTYIPRKLEVCMVCMYVWGSIHTQKRRGMYVCMHGPNVHTSKARVCTISDTQKSRTYPVCMYFRGNIHTQKIRGMYGMYGCLGKDIYLEKKRHVCMYVCIVRTYRPQKHGYECSSETQHQVKSEVCVFRRAPSLRYVCFPGRYIRMSVSVCMFPTNIHTHYYPGMSVSHKHIYLGLGGMYVV